MAIDEAKIAELRQREDARFVAERPKSAKLIREARKCMPDGVPMAWMTSLYAHSPFFVKEAKGAYITDVDGHHYLDMNLADSSMACGYGLDVVADAISAQFRRGSQYLLPTEQSIRVAQTLAQRFSLPYWQFTLSASNANTEAIRIARAYTERDRVLIFDGKYHGMLDETSHYLDSDGLNPEVRGLPRNAGSATDIVPYNDLAAAERVLANGQTACVLVEAAVTNVGGVLMPKPGFLEDLCALSRRSGSVFVIDETHTHVCAFGGLKRAWNLDCDILVLGKGVAGGLPVGLYGLTETLAQFMVASNAPGHHPLAIGGTLFGNPLQMAAIEATLEHVLTEAAQLEAARLGAKLADGIEVAANKRGLPWSAHRLYCRSGYHFVETLPNDNADIIAAANDALRELMRVYMANRGVWEAVFSASPAVSLAANDSDVELYLSVYEACLEELTS